MQRKTFGKRQHSVPVFSQGPVPAKDLKSSPEDSAKSSEKHLDLAHLDANRSRLRLIAQLVGAVGIVILFGVAVQWPVHPHIPNLVSNTIYVPMSLGTELKAYKLATTSQEFFNGQPDVLLNICLAVLLFFSWVAIYKRLWIVVATISALLIFPWEYFGIPITYRAFQITSLIVLVPLRLMQFPKWVTVVLVVIGIVAGVPLLMFINDKMLEVVPDFDDKYVRYALVSAKRLAGDDKLMDRWKAFSSPEAHASDPPEIASARAFARAHERYRQSDIVGLQAAITHLDQLKQPSNLFEQSRIALMRDYVVVKGGKGEAAKARVHAAFKTKVNRSWMVAIPGILAILFGIFSQFLVNRIRSRSQRIKTVQRELEETTRANHHLAQSEYAASSSHKKIREPQTESITALDAGEKIEDLQTRVHRYAVSTAILLAIGLLALGAKFLFGLPPVDQNGAFSEIALLWDVARYGSVTEILPEGVFGTRQTFSLMFMLSPFILIVAIFLCFLRKSKMPALVALLVAVIFKFAGPYISTPSPNYEVQAAALKPHHRHALAVRAGLAKETSLSKQKFAKQFKAVERDHALFTLAQIAYVENDPTRTGLLLDRIQDFNGFRPPYSKRRLIIMREWIASKGIRVSGDPWTAITSIPPSVARTMAGASGYISVVAIFGTLVMLMLGGIANRRKRNLNGLLTERELAAPRRHTGGIQTNHEPPKTESVEDSVPGFVQPDRFETIETAPGETAPGKNPIFGPLLTMAKVSAGLLLVAGLVGFAYGPVSSNMVLHLLNNGGKVSLTPDGRPLDEVFPKAWEMGPRVDGIPLGSRGKSDACLNFFKIEPERPRKNASSAEQKRYRQRHDIWEMKKDRLCYTTAKK